MNQLRYSFNFLSLFYQSNILWTHLTYSYYSLFIIWNTGKYLTLLKLFY